MTPGNAAPLAFARGGGEAAGIVSAWPLDFLSAALAAASTLRTRTPSGPSVRGLRAGAHAIEKMLALKLQRLAFFERHRLRLGLGRHGLRVAPFDAMRIEQQLARPRLAVVEHGHGAVADHDELLLLERMQPRHMNMRAFAAGEGEVRRRHVGDGAVQVIAALRRHAFGLLRNQSENHRHVMRRERPKRVFFAPDAAEIEAVGIDVLQPSERALAHHLFQFQEGRMILQQMADHEPPVAPLGQLDKNLGLAHIERQRFLDEHVLAGFERGARQVGMGRGRAPRWRRRRWI